MGVCSSGVFIKPRMEWNGMESNGTHASFKLSFCTNLPIYLLHYMLYLIVTSQKITAPSLSTQRSI